MKSPETATKYTVSGYKVSVCGYKVSVPGYKVSVSGYKLSCFGNKYGQTIRNITNVALFFVCLGQSLESVLSTLKNRHQPVLKAVLKKYKQYAACTRLLDTGYFKRFVRRVPLLRTKTQLHHGASKDTDSSDFRPKHCTDLQ